MHAVDTVCDNAHGINVKARVGLVEDRELWLKHCHLEYLVAFLLSSAKALVDGPPGKLAVESHQLPLLAHELYEVCGVEWLKPLILPLLVDGGFHEVGHRHTRYLHRILERQEQSLVSPVLRLHLKQVLAIEDGLSSGDGVERITCKDG